MKNFSFGSTTLVFALVAAICTCLFELRSNQHLRQQLEGLHETIEQREGVVDHQLQQLADTRLGSALLCRMAFTEDYSEMFDFLRPIPAESLACRTVEFPEYADLKMISFHHRRQ